MKSEVRVRFAPSPTGYLHIGNARTALFNWLFARKKNGVFILRIEDTDIERSSERYENSVLEDLRWLGLEWDEGPDKGGEYGPYKQSLRNTIYNEYFSKLRKKGLVYPCYCTQEELEARRKISLKKGKAPRYDNRCRDLSKAEITEYEKKGRKASWRFKVPEKKVTVKDLIRGEIIFDTSFIGDFIIIKQDGTPTFNFAVSVDDMCMKITHVIRGEDHLSNTPRHILLWEAFGGKIPLFAHNTLTLGPDEERLSKRHGAVSIREYRKSGYLPEGLLNYLALLGWSSGTKKEIYDPKELIGVFSLEGLSSGQALFNKDKLDWVNANHIRNLDTGKLTNLCIPYLIKSKLIKGPVSEKKFILLEKMIGVIKENLVVLGQCAGYMRIFLCDSIEIKDSRAKDLLRQGYVRNLFSILSELFSKTEDLSAEKIKQIFQNAQEKAGIKGKDFYMPIRVALTGMLEGPELINVIPLLDKEKILNRLCL